MTAAGALAHLLEVSVDAGDAKQSLGREAEADERDEVLVLVERGVVSGPHEGYVPGAVGVTDGEPVDDDAIRQLDGCLVATDQGDDLGCDGLAPVRVGHPCLGQAVVEALRPEPVLGVVTTTPVAVALRQVPVHALEGDAVVHLP